MRYKLGSAILASVLLVSLSNSASALRYCALDTKNPQTGSWDTQVYAGRGDEFGTGTVKKLDDGDKCRRNGRKIGPSHCQAENTDTYRIRAGKNGGTEKKWIETC